MALIKTSLISFTKMISERKTKEEAIIYYANALDKRNEQKNFIFIFLIFSEGDRARKTRQLNKTVNYESLQNTFSKQNCPELPLRVTNLPVFLHQSSAFTKCAVSNLETVKPWNESTLNSSLSFSSDMMFLLSAGSFQEKNAISILNSTTKNPHNLCFLKFRNILADKMHACR